MSAGRAAARLRVLRRGPKPAGLPGRARRSTTTPSSIRRAARSARSRSVVLRDARRSRPAAVSARQTIGHRRARSRGALARAAAAPPHPDRASRDAHAERQRAQTRRHSGRSRFRAWRAEAPSGVRSPEVRARFQNCTGCGTDDRCGKAGGRSHQRRQWCSRTSARRLGTRVVLFRCCAARARLQTPARSARRGLRRRAEVRTVFSIPEAGDSGDSFEPPFGVDATIPKERRAREPRERAHFRRTFDQPEIDPTQPLRMSHRAAGGSRYTPFLFIKVRGREPTRDQIGDQ